MREPTSSFPSARPMLHAALATLGLTAAHHVYGGLVYDTPWRIHGAAAAVGIAGAIYALSALYARATRPGARRIAGTTVVTLVLVFPVILTGALEGIYNHLVKNAMALGGAPDDVLVRMFPPPRYQMPDDAVFELSGVAQIVPAGYALAAALRFVAALFGRARACTRRRCLRTLPLRALFTVTDDPVELPDRERLVHLQFRRFAGCPVCSLHLRSFVRRHGALEAAGVREIVVFHSRPEELRVHAGDLPFAVIADPDRRLYDELGVESGRRALLDPRAWGPIVIGVVRSAIAIVMQRERAPSLDPEGGRFGLPADFLIAPDGRIVACKHGRHAYDQWSVDDVLALAARGEAARSPAPVRAPIVTW